MADSKNLEVKRLQELLQKAQDEIEKYKVRVTEAEMRETRAHRIVELLAQALANRSD